MPQNKKQQADYLKGICLFLFNPFNNIQKENNHINKHHSSGDEGNQ